VNDLFYTIRDILAVDNPEISKINPIFTEPRKGDILHSFANIDKARNILGFEPQIGLKEGLENTIGYYKKEI
jgi:nucleoside-diphosphate-sugar epimerase